MPLYLYATFNACRKSFQRRGLSPWLLFYWLSKFFAIAGTLIKYTGLISLIFPYMFKTVKIRFAHWTAARLERLPYWIKSEGMSMNVPWEDQKCCPRSPGLKSLGLFKVGSIILCDNMILWISRGSWCVADTREIIRTTDFMTSMNLS